MAYPYDNEVFSRMTAIATCLCAKNEERGLPGFCFCGIIAGDQPYDATGVGGECEDDECGQAWVRLSTGYPSSVVGIADITPSNCNKGLGIEIEVGILRCFPIGENGEPPSAEDMLAATQLQVADMLLMREAISCCTAVDDEDMVMGQYLPIGPEGGLVGGVWPLSLLVV